METVIQVINNSIPIFFVIALTLYFRRLGKFTDATKDALTPIIFQFVLPFFAFNVLYDITFNSNDLPIVFLVAVINILILGLVYLFCKLKGKKQDFTGSLLLSFLGYSVGTIAYPFVQLNFNGDVFEKVVVMDIVLFVTIMILGPIIAVLADPKTDKISVRSIIKSIITDKILIAVTLATIVNATNIVLPDFVTNTTGFIAQIFPPLVMIYLALIIKKPNLKRIRFLLSTYLIRVLLIVILGTLIVVTLSPETDVRNALFLTMITPFSSFGLVYSEKHNLDSELIAELSLTSMIVTLAAYPLIIIVLKSI